MTMRTLVSKSGAPIVEIQAWVASKNDPEMSALLAIHEANIIAGKELAPMENLEMDNFYNQFFAETNQELA